MMHRMLLIGLLLEFTLLFGSRAAAETDTQAGADSPKAALKAQDVAAKSGDVEADMQFYQADDDQQKKLVRAIAEGDVAVSKLEKAVTDRFGKELAAATVRAAGTEDAKALDAATEDIDGDHAIIHFAGQPASVPMIRADGKWKVSIAEWTKGATPHDLELLTSRLAELTTQLNQVTDLVSHDKFRTRRRRSRSYSGTARSAVWGTARTEVILARLRTRLQISNRNSTVRPSLLSAPAGNFRIRNKSGDGMIQIDWQHHPNLSLGGWLVDVI